MIFVFLDDGTLDVIANLEEAQRDYEGIDVQNSLYQFFDEMGVCLEPHFTVPNEKGRFFVVSGQFELVPNTETDADIKLYLSEISEINPNPYFNSLEEVRQFFQRNQNNRKLS